MNGIQQTVLANGSNKQKWVREIKRHYNLLHPKGCKPTPIIFAVTINSKQVRFSVGVKVYPNHWLGERAKDYNLPLVDIANNKIVNNALNNIDAKFARYIDDVNNGTMALNEVNLLLAMGKKSKDTKVDVIRDLKNGEAYRSQEEKLKILRLISVMGICVI